MNATNAVTADETRQIVSALPCRGCTRQCKSYGRCQGKPWQLNDEMQRKVQPEQA